MSTLKEHRVVELLRLASVQSEVILPAAELREILAYAVGCRKAQAERDLAQVGLKRVIEKLDALLKERLHDDDDLGRSDLERPAEATGVRGGPEARAD